MYGGVLTVLEELKVKNVIISKQFEQSENYEKFKKVTKNKKISVNEVKKGDIIKIEKDLKLRILFPTKIIKKENRWKNNAIVARWEYKSFKRLFTGDIEKKAEEKILNLYEKTNYLKADILKVAHHRS